jgi:ACS family glucarate transporter-like MFS transporter
MAASPDALSSARTAASTLGPATTVRFQVLAAGCSVAFLTYIHRVGFARALPYIENDLKLTDVQSSLAVALFMVAYGGFEVPAGVLGDRLGVRHVLTVLVLGWSVMTGLASLVGLAPPIWMLPFLLLLFNRFCFGMFQAGAFPSLSRMMADWMPIQERASAQGAIWMASRLGGLVVPLLIGWLVLRCGNWQAPLWIVSSLGLVWCAAFWPWFRNRPEDMAKTNEAERTWIATGRKSNMAVHGPVPWARFFRSRSVWALCLTYGCGGFAANFYVTLLPKYLQNQRHLSEDHTNLLSSLPFACGIVACLGGGLLSDWIIRRTGNRKWGRRLNGSVGMVLGGLGWLAIDHVGSLWGLAFLLCFIFFCNDLAMGPAWASCADIGEQHAGALGGAMNMIGNLAGAMGNLVAGFLFSKEFVLRSLNGSEFPIAGNNLLFVIYGCAFWLAALGWQGVDVTKTLMPDPGEQGEAPSQ